ncbi:hypothetical protein BDR22DRAFT_890910 [Usnea florida]
MSSSTSEQVLHPQNPILLKDVNTPRERGQTRVLPDGGLLYREPITDTEVPAVRLQDIRPRLVEQASTKKSYRFPKKRGYEDTNVTAFVKKDYNYGPNRANWPDRLFQIENIDSKSELPNGYVKDEGRIVLDAFDHGLRDFGNQLPMYVSSEVEGRDIEDYLRRNWEITVYDLIARAPNGYYLGEPEPIRKSSRDRKKDKKAEETVTREWHEGPPRVGTFSMRATRFRLRAGCLSWAKKDGTAAKNQRILDVIPAQYKDPAVNSTKGWRDLNKAEIKRVNAGALKKPQLGPKDKRAADAAKKAEELQGSANSAEEGTQGKREEFTSGDTDEEYVHLPEVRSSVKDAAISIPRPSANIKQEEDVNLAGGDTHHSKSRKRSLEEDPGYSRDVKDDPEFRPSKKRRTRDLPSKSQGTQNGTICAPHKGPKVRKPRHGDSKAPEPKQTAERPTLFSSASNQHRQQSPRPYTASPSDRYNQQSPHPYTASPLDQHNQQSPHPYTVHSRDTLGIAMPLEPPFHGNHGQAYGSGEAYHSHGSSLDEDFDEWLRSQMRETQMYEDYGKDSFQNQLLRQLSPHQNEGFAQKPVSTCLRSGFAGVYLQGRGFGVSHLDQFSPGAQYSNFPSETQLGSLPDSLPQQGYSQYDPAQEGFPQNGFYDTDFTQTGLPQNNGFLGELRQENSQQGWFSQYQTDGYQW